MATVDKNFRIKNGLAVEGTTATVNGNDILTKNTQDGDSYIINLIGGSADTANTPNAVVKRDGSGAFAAGQVTVTELNIGTIGHIWDDGDLMISNTDGNDVILQGEDIRLNAADDVRLNAGTVGDVFIQATSGNINLQGPNVYVGENLNYVDSERVASQGYVDDSIANIDLTFNTDEITEGQSNLYFTNQRAIDAGDGVFDGFGAAAAAQTAAQNYADGLAPNYDAAGSATAAENNAKGYADSLASNYDAAGAAAAAQTAAQGYADSLINDGSTTSTNNWSAYKTSTEIGLAQTAAQDYADDAVAALVGSAPAVLDTIQELATALENNPDIIADLENVAAGKQDTLTAGSNIDITGATISVTGLDTADVAEDASRLYFTDQRALDSTSAAYDAIGSASLAQSAAEQTALGYVSDVLDGTTAFTDLNINDVAKQIAARTTSLGSVPVVAYQFNKSAFKSGKFLVKIDNGTHNEISEILVTLDASGNVAITEYAIVGTNGTRGTITANTDATHCRIVVDPVNDSTITVSGTIFNS